MTTPRKKSILAYAIFFSLLFLVLVFAFSSNPKKDKIQSSAEGDSMEGKELIETIRLDCSETQGFLKSIEVQQDEDTLYINSDLCNEVEKNIVYQFVLQLDKKTYQFDVSQGTEPTGVELVNSKPKNIPYKQVLKGSLDGKRLSLVVPKSLIGEYSTLSMSVFVKEKPSYKVKYELSRELL